MRKRLVITASIICVLALLCVGCATKENNIGDSKSTQITKEDKEKANKEHKTDDNKKISSYATANYFNEDNAKVLQINYFSKGDKFEFKADTKEGKKFLDLVKKRFVNFGERVTKDIVLKDKIEDIKKNGRAIEVKFEKGYIKAVEAQKNTDFKSLPIEVESWFFPIDCDEECYFTYLPQGDYTFSKLGDSSELQKYISSLNLK